MKAKSDSVLIRSPNNGKAAKAPLSETGRQASRRASRANSVVFGSTEHGKNCDRDDAD